MGLWRRLLLIPAGFILAMTFNVCRMSFLTMVAARKGVAAIAQYHDPAGVTITLLCTAGLWGLAMLFKKKLKLEMLKAEIGGQVSALQRFSFPLFNLCFALFIWLIAVEVGTELWYRNLESHRAPSPNWSATFPEDNRTFRTMPMDAKTENQLRFDEGKQGAWIDSDGFRWQAFYFNWRPGRVAGYLAKRHTPEICLPAAGCRMVSGPELTMMNINGVALPVRSYTFETEGNAMYVFHCRWEAGVKADAYVAHESARFNLVRGIWSGRGKFGQKILEIIISGCPDAGQAKAALARELQTMIKAEKLEGKR
jgi:exosortase/archaeosortase family protein